MSRDVIIGIVMVVIGIGVIGLGFYLKQKGIPVQTNIFLNRELIDRNILAEEGLPHQMVIPFVIGYFFILLGLLVISFERSFLEGSFPPPKIFGGLIFLSGGALCIFLMRTITGRTDEIRTWPSVEGIVHEVHAPTTDDLLSGKVAAKDAIARIVYEYRVKNEPHTSGRVSLEDKSGTAGYTQYIHDTFFKGKQVKVYYNPKKPSESVLEPPASSDMKLVKYAGYIGGALFALLGLLIMIIPTEN